MRTPIEIFETNLFEYNSHRNTNESFHDVMIKSIEQAQIEAYNQALNDSIEYGLKPFYDAGYTNTANKSKKAILILKK